MSAGSWSVTLAGLFAFAVAGFAAARDGNVREWAASAAGRRWTRRVGVLAAVVCGAAAASFSVSPPAGVYLFAAGGLLGFTAAVLAAAGAAHHALDAPGEASFARRVRGFWYAAGVEFRATRYALAVSLVGFLLAAMAGGVAVNPVLSAVAAFALGGVLACVAGFAAVGVFVPGSRTRPVAPDVEETG